jgi:bla regulator protein blaR1
MTGNLSRRALVQCSIAICAWAAGLGAPAQTAGNSAEPVFDVATIRPSMPGAGGATYSFTADGGIKVANGTLKGMMEMAYDVRDFQIVGGPGWTDSESFDVVAKNTTVEADSATGNSGSGIQQARLRLRALLGERFRLLIRQESKDLPEYVLTVARNGPKIKANQSTGPNAGINAACGQMTATHATMANLAYKLSRALDRPVLDQTALTGNYDFVLSWTPETGPCATSDSAPAANSPAGPSLFTAIQEQLGLKLESAKGPVDVLVIDRAERPSAN